jgi:hypothetical protein
MADWLVAFGTIVLAVLAVFQDRIRSWFWSPKLDCTISLHPPDCHRTISLLGDKQFFSFYYLLEIWNKGNVSARNVEVLIVDVQRKEGTSFKMIDSFLPDNLKWSTLFDVSGDRLISKRYCEYISPDSFKHCNLGHIHDPAYRKADGDDSHLSISEKETIFCFDVHFMSTKRYYLVGPGVYRVKIKVGCENAKTITRSYQITITGKWFEDETRMLNEGVTIEQVWKHL